MKNLRLNNGIDIPQIGFGTAAIGEWQQDDGYVQEVILRAIHCGYRHIDTASIYGNERSVGRAIRESGLAREEFFIVSKVWDNEQGTEKCRAAFEKSMNRLQLDYLDLYLVHWPVPDKTEKTWRVLEQLYDGGHVRAVGLSNFRVSDIEQLLSLAEVNPACNQIELHPYFTQESLCKYCQDRDIVVSCWSPLGSGSWSGVAVEEKPVADRTIVGLAEKYGVTSAQVILQWNIQHNRIVIPKAESLTHMENNLKLDGFTLDAEDIQAINGLHKKLRFGGDPDTAYRGNMQMVVPE